MRNSAIESRLRGTRQVAVAVAVIGAVVLTTVVTVLVAARDGGSERAAATPNTSPLSQTVSAEPATTVDVAPVRTATDAAEQLYFAWQRGDRSGATRFADAPAVAALFAIKTTAAAGLAFGGCTQPVAQRSVCRWSRRDARLTMRVVTPTTGSPHVQSAELR